MTAYDDAIRQVIADARTVDRRSRPGAAEVARRQARAGARGAAVAAAAGVMAVGPTTAALAADQPPAELPPQAEQPPPAEPPTAEEPPAEPPAAERPAAEPPAAEEPPAEEPPPAAPAPVVPGLTDPVVIPLDGRETRPPDPPPPAGPGPSIPQQGQPESLGGRPPVPPAPEPVPEAPIPPPPPTRPVIVGSAPPPPPAGGGSTDLSEDFSDPDEPSVETTPLPLGGTETYVVMAGDSLWSIATELLVQQDGSVTTSEVDLAVDVLYAVNREVIGGDPDLLLIGTTLEIPAELGEPDDEAG